MKMIWCGLKIKENYHVLVNQFHGNYHSKNVKWCFNASWGLKGLRVNKYMYTVYQYLQEKWFDILVNIFCIFQTSWPSWRCSQRTRAPGSSCSSPRSSRCLFSPGSTTYSCWRAVIPWRDTESPARWESRTRGSWKLRPVVPGVGISSRRGW